MADTKEPGAESTSISEEVRVSRRGFLHLSIAGIAGLLVLGTLGCGGSRDGDGGNGNGSKKEENKDDGGGGAGGY